MKDPSIRSRMGSYFPGILLPLILFAMFVFSWPAILETFISLEWRVGDVRPVAYGLQVLFALLALVFLLRVQKINVTFRRALSSRKESAFTVIGLLLTLLVSILIIEFALRLLDLPYKTSWSPAEYRRVQFDPALGWAYIPNKSTSQQFVKGQPNIPLYSDKFGARVGAEGYHTDPSEPSALFVGGSFTYGFGVPYEDTFAGQLDAMPEFNLQPVNLGVEAYGTDQALLLLKRYLYEFDTRLVVYTFIYDHKLRNTNYDRRLLVRGARFTGTKPLFGLDDDDKLFLKKRPLRYSEMTDIRILAFVKFALTRWGPIPSIDVTKALLQEMQDLVESRGAEFVVVYWNSGYTYERALVPPLFANADYSVIDTSNDAPPDWSEWRIPGDTHPSARAHDRVARLIAGEISTLYPSLSLTEK